LFGIKKENLTGDKETGDNSITSSFKFCALISYVVLIMFMGGKMCETCSMTAREEERMQQYFEVVKGRDQNCVKRINCALEKRKKKPQI
jgi:hypothetical protein